MSNHPSPVVLGPVLLLPALLCLWLAGPSLASSPEAQPPVDGAAARPAGLAPEVERWTQVFSATYGPEELDAAHSLGIAYFDAGMFVEAYYFLSYFVEFSVDETAVKDARTALMDLEGDLAVGAGRIEIRTAPAKARICMSTRLDRCLKAPFVWYFRPGPVRIVVSQVGFEEKVLEFVVEDGPPVVRKVVLARKSGVAPPSEPDDPVAAAGSPPEASLWPWVLGTGGLGVVLLGGGLEFLAWSRNQELTSASYQEKHYSGLGAAAASSRLSNDFDSDVAPLNTAGVTLLIVGGGLVAAGVMWYLLDDSGAQPSALLVPMMGPDLGGVSVWVGF